MNWLRAGLVAGALCATLTAPPLSAPAKADARGDIKALEDRLITAVKAKDVDAIMKVYVPDESLFVFDVVPPRQYVGAAAYRKDWHFLAIFAGPITVELTDFAVVTDHNLGYGHSIQRVAGADKAGKTIDLTVRVTDVYKKIKGQWLIIHEHLSLIHI